MTNYPPKYASYGPTNSEELHLQSEAGRTNRKNKCFHTIVCIYKYRYINNYQPLDTMLNYI